MTGARGEVQLTVPQGPVRLLFTNRALAQAETTSGLSIMKIVTAMSEKDVSQNLLAALLQAGMQAARREAGQPGAVSLDEAWVVIEALGYRAVLVPVVEAVAAVFSWGAEETDSPPAEPVGTGADS
jgi:hypothetical protein